MLYHNLSYIVSYFNSPPNQFLLDKERTTLCDILYRLRTFCIYYTIFMYFSKPQNEFTGLLFIRLTSCTQESWVTPNPPAAISTNGSVEAAFAHQRNLRRKWHQWFLSFLVVKMLFLIRTTVGCHERDAAISDKFCSKHGKILQ